MGSIRLSAVGYSSSGSYRAYTIRLSAVGYSSSGSYRAYTIRLSEVGFSPSGSYRFGLGRVCSSALFFSLPIRRDLSPNKLSYGVTPDK